MTGAARSPLDHDPVEAAAAATGVSHQVLAAGASADDLRAAWSALAPEQRAVLAALVGLGGASAETLLVAEACEELAAAEGVDEPADVHGRVVQGLDAAWERGLVVARRMAPGERRHALVPQLADAFADLAAEDLEAAAANAAPDDDDRGTDEHALTCTAALLLEDPVPLTREGRPYKRQLEAMAERLAALVSSPDDVEERLEILRRAGLARREDATLTADVPALLRWSEQPPPARAATLLGASRDDALLLLALVRQLPEAPVARRVAGRLFRRALLRRGSAESGSDAFGLQALASQRFDRAAAALGAAGLVTGSQALRLTALGRSFPDAPETDAPTSVHVQPDLSVLVPHGLDPHVHLSFARLARLEKADVVARYRLDRRVMLEALDQGLDVEAVFELLETHAAPRLPDSVREDVRRWCERFGEVTAHEGIVVACRVERRRAELDALVAETILRVESVAPGVAVVARGDHEAFHRELVAAGFTPRRRVLAPGGAEASDTGEEGSPSATTGDLRAALDDVARWNDVDASLGGTLLPPRAELVRRLQAKYRRDLGSVGVAPLELLDVDELVALEEGGRVRQYLESVQDAAPRGRTAPDLRDYAGTALVTVATERAGAVLALAAAGGLRCQIAYLVRSGRRTRLVVEPLDVTDDGPSGYARVRVVASGDERMIPLDRIQALRVLAAGRGE